MAIGIGSIVQLGQAVGIVTKLSQSNATIYWFGAIYDPSTNTWRVPGAPGAQTERFNFTPIDVSNLVEVVST